MCVVFVRVRVSFVRVVCDVLCHAVRFCVCCVVFVHVLQCVCMLFVICCAML